MSNVTVLDLVRNGTLNAEMAAVIWGAVDERLSFLTVALPRLAGKSTTSNAFLALRQDDVPLHSITGSARQFEQLQNQRLGGYLVVNEFSQAPLPGYIWGEPVRRVFQTLPYGYSLQTSLHAQSVEEALQVVTRGNGVSDADASVFKLVLYIERFGADSSTYWRRLVELYELHGVENGKPIGRPLFRWNQQDDSFEKLADPQQFGEAADLAQRAAIIKRLAGDSRANENDLMKAVRQFHDD